MSFVERHGLWSAEQKEAASRLRRIVEEQKLEVIRLSFPDQHGILRGKTLVASEALASLESGCSITTTHARQGHLAPHGVSGVHLRRRLRHEGDGRRRRRADGGRSHHVPRAAVGADHGLAAVRPPFRRRPAGAVRDAPPLSRRCSISSAQRGYDFVAGLEVEFHLFKLEDAQMAPEDAGQPGTPPSVSLLSHGYQYLTEQRYDQMEPALEIIRRDVLALGLPLALGRGRVRPEPVRIHLCADQGARRPPTTWCCSARP